METGVLWEDQKLTSDEQNLRNSFLTKNALLFMHHVIFFNPIYSARFSHSLSAIFSCLHV